VERNKEGDGFVRFRWGETKEQDAVGGARLTIEIGADFGSSALSMMAALPRLFTTENSLENEDRRADWRLWIIKSAEEPRFPDRYHTA
jgi:hypothetical protein